MPNKYAFDEMTNKTQDKKMRISSSFSVILNIGKNPFGKSIIFKLNGLFFKNTREITDYINLNKKVTVFLRRNHIVNSKIIF